MSKKIPQIEAVFQCSGNNEDTMEVNTFTRLLMGDSDPVAVVAFDMQIAQHPEDPPEHCVLLSYAETKRLHTLLGLILGDDK